MHQHGPHACLRLNLDHPLSVMSRRVVYARVCACMFHKAIESSPMEMTRYQLIVERKKNTCMIHNWPQRARCCLKGEKCASRAERLRCTFHMRTGHAYEVFRSNPATRRTNHACQSFGEYVDAIVLSRGSQVVTQLGTLFSLEGGTSGVFHSHRPRQKKVNKKINDDEFTAKNQE